MRDNTDLPETGFVTTQWAKHRYQISNSTLYGWIKSGKLPPLYRIGPRAVRFRVEDIRDFEATFAATPAAAE